MNRLSLPKSLILLCLLLGVAACGREARPNLPYLGSDDIVLAFGDSLTHGTGAKATAAYPAVLQDLIGRRVVKVATPGDQTGAGLEKLPAALAEHEPDLVILCLGGNDFLRKRPEQDTRENLRRMIEMIRSSGAAIVLLGVPKPGIFGLDGHELYTDLAKQYDLVLDNHSIPEILSDRDLKSDAIHPNAAGYRELALALEELLRAAGAI